MYVENLEQSSAFKFITQLFVIGKASPLFGLPSFSLYSLKFGFGFDNLNEHMQILLDLFRDRKLIEQKRYHKDVIYTLRTFGDFARKAQEMLKMSFLQPEEKDILAMDKRQVEMKLDFSKKINTDPVRYAFNIVNRQFTPEVLNFLLKFTKDFA